MSKAEIFEAISKLTKEERHEIRTQLAEMDGDGWLDAGDPLTGAEKAGLEARLVAYEQNPDAGSSWEEVESRIRAQLKA